MAAKLLHSLADDNPDLQKQIGCMTGMLQIFYRQHVGKRLSGHSHKRLLPPGNSQFNNASLDADSSNAYNQETMERTRNRYANDKRASTESSRASFSSSSSTSSFSSLDCGRIGHPDPSSLVRIIFPETPSTDPIITQPSASLRSGRLSLDLRDVVKDSMHREAKGLSVPTSMKEDGVGHVSNPRGHPRSLRLSNSMDGSQGSTINGNNDLPADLNESKVLAKLREAPCYYTDKKHARLSYETKEGSKLSVSRDAPRYSYDGKEMNSLSFEPQDISKSNRTIKELQRLSLDSRESSMRTSSYVSNLAYLSTTVQNGNDSSNEKVPNTKQLSRPPNVVGKLMGLETFPDNKTGDGQFRSVTTLEDYDPRSLPSKMSDLCRSIRLPVSPRSSKKEPISPRWKNTEMKPISSSKCPMEPAPWRHLEGSRSSQQVTRRQKSPESNSKSSPSVYSEIEKRLKDIEFKKSGKDLRALKQILEAMQTKGFLGMTKEERNCDMETKTVEEPAYTGPSMNSGIINGNESHKNYAGASMLRGTSSSKSYESPIVIMKPAKLVQKSGIPASTLFPFDSLPDLLAQGSDIAHHGKCSVNCKPAKDQSFRESQRDSTARSSIERKANNRTLRDVQNSVRAQRVSKDNSVSSCKNSGSTSQRLQKKLEFDKRSRPPTPPDSSKSRRQPDHQLTESGGSPGGRCWPKPSVAKQNAEQLSKGSSDSRNFTTLGDDVTIQSNSVVTLESKRDVGITRNEKSAEITKSQMLHLEAIKCPEASKIKTSSSTRSSVDDLPEELPAVSPEYPSPISVLDGSAYRANSPPPVKQSPHDIEAIGAKILETDHGEEHWNPSNELSANHDDGSGFNRSKLQSIESLVQKLRRLNSSHDEAHTDYVASLCENSDPAHRYVSEILVTSGLLLRDLSSGLATFQLHPSGHPINPELFLVLEQTKLSSLLSKVECSPNDKATQLKHHQEKFHRKLIFDAVNETLMLKLASLWQVAEPWVKPNKLARKALNAQKLLRELCAEIDNLSASRRQEFDLDEEDDALKSILWGDMMDRSDSWTDFDGEIAGVVLNVERSIFKDLVDEVVTGATCGKPGRGRRQLFSK